MTGDEFKAVAKKLRIAYQRDKFLSDNDSISLWDERLGSLDYDTLLKAVNNYIDKNSYQPTIADIMSEYQKIVDAKRAVKRELLEIYDRTRGIYPGSTDDNETKQAWWDLISTKPESEWVAFARRVEETTNKYVTLIEQSNRETIPTITEFFRGKR